MTGEELFSQFKRSTAYIHLENLEEIKRTITTLFWQEDAPKLRERFPMDDGIKRNGDGIQEEVGFGFLVEAIARRSSSFPKNSESAERLASLILGALHSGDATIGVGKSLRNPDIIWIEFRGKRAEITGIAEIKSSAQAAAQNLVQLAYQERSIRRFVEEVDAKKVAGSAIGYFAKRKITAADTLKKILIMPAGVRSEVERKVPADWQVEEIEFSHSELVFLAKAVWPKAFPKIQFADAEAAATKKKQAWADLFEERFLRRLDEWASRRFKEVFSGITVIKKFPTRELTLFNFTTRTLPLLDAEISHARDIVRRVKFSVLEQDNRLRKENLDEWEQKFFNVFAFLWGEKAIGDILHFLLRLRIFKTEFQNALKRSRIPIRNTEKYDLLQTVKF